jgi:hypothetical protein
MPGLKREARLRAGVPGIHVLALLQKKTWMAGTSPAMTQEKPSSLLANVKYLFDNSKY